MDEWLQFVARRLAGEAMAELCREFGISRKTGYKIFDRYQECGIHGLTDRSRRPYRYANQLPFQVENYILNVKHEHPSWGARKIRDQLLRRFSGIPIPVKSTQEFAADQLDKKATRVVHSGIKDGSPVVNRGGSMTRRKKIIYWISTLWLALGMLATGTLQLFRVKAEGALAPPGVYGITHLGYPIYFLTILGVWKILGVVAVLIPKFPLLKEWAYAGFFFVMTGAAFSHIAVGDPMNELVPSLFLLVLTMVSWYSRPTGRKIPALHIAEACETDLQLGTPVQQRS